jgi:hypothetical protein
MALINKLNLYSPARGLRLAIVETVGRWKEEFAKWLGTLFSQECGRFKKNSQRVPV